VTHLVKLEDYISRYQFDLNRYPSQFTRMKKERWSYVKSEWEQLQYDSTSAEEILEEEKGRFFGILQKVKNWSRYTKKKQYEDINESDSHLTNDV
jgi:hypothetical protein